MASIYIYLMVYIYKLNMVLIIKYSNETVLQII